MATSKDQVYELSLHALDTGIGFVSASLTFIGDCIPVSVNGHDSVVAFNTLYFM